MNQVLVARDRDADLIPSNVRAGVTIYDTLGTYTGEGGLPPGGAFGMFDIDMVQHSGVPYNSPEIRTPYYYEDSNFISSFVERKYGDSNGRYVGTILYFNIDKSGGETYLYSVGSISQGLLHRAYITTITEYGIFEDTDYIYYIVSGTGANVYAPYEALKSIGITKFNKITHVITNESHDLTQASGYVRGNEELTYLPVGYAPFINPSPIPTDLYWEVYSSIYSGAYLKLPYITNT